MICEEVWPRKVRSGRTTNEKKQNNDTSNTIFVVVDDSRNAVVTVRVTLNDDSVKGMPVSVTMNDEGSAVVRKFGVTLHWGVIVSAPEPLEPEPSRTSDDVQAAMGDVADMDAEGLTGLGLAASDADPMATDCPSAL